MSDEQIGLTEQQQAEIKTRLEKLAEKDRKAVVLFASRCALRVFPVLAWPYEQGFFSYWKEQDKIKHLLSVWRALLISCDAHSDEVSKANALLKSSKARTYIWQANETIEDLTSREKSVTIAAYVAYSAYVGSRSTQNASNAALACAKTYFDVYIFELLRQEIVLLEREGSQVLEQAPLWLSPKSSEEYWREAEGFLSEALSQLAEQSLQSEPQAAEIIQQIYPLYLGIYEGKPDKRGISQALDQLDAYFERLEGQETPSPKEASGSARQNTSLFEDRFYGSSRHNRHDLAKEDKLNREQLVTSLATVLLEPGNSGHQTIGLLGHWGAGKSSVVNLLKQALLKHREEQPFLIAEFNAWEYEHTDNLQAGIAQEMIKALSSPIPKAKPNKLVWWKALGLKCWDLVYQKLIWRFMLRPGLTLRFAWRMQGIKLLVPLVLLIVAILPFWLPKAGIELVTNSLSGWGEWLKTVLPTAWVIGFLYPTIKQTLQVFASPMAKELKTYLKLPSYAKHLGMIPEMRQHIQQLTKVRLNPLFNMKGLAKQKRLLYVVDDLDRCNPEKIVKVLEAVRLVLDLERVTVIIAVDQRIALAALALHYEKLEKHHPSNNARQIARDYLAKIIHLPIQLTDPNNDAVVGYLNHLWEETGQGEEEEAPRHSDQPSVAESQSEQNAQEEGASASSTEASHESAESTDPETPPELLNLSDGFKLGDELNPPLPVEVRPYKRLSKAQKVAFIHWVDHFGLSNPRQLKRLNNSYNFLCQYYRQDTLNNDIEHGFPMLVTLSALEYVNNLEDKTLRDQLKQLLKREGSQNEASEENQPKDDNKITPEVIALTSAKLDPDSESSILFVDAIEPFVLPALEQVDIEGKSKST